MTTKIIERSYPGLEKTSWVWPDTDDIMFQGIFDAYKGDQEKILEHCPSRRVCIQAGGACGVWPLRWAQDFEHVHTFEIHPDNFNCLFQNIVGQANIFPYNLALGEKEKFVKVCTPSHKPRNHGVFYVMESGGAGSDHNCITIDSLELENVDLIQLDIEGGELDALVGAYETIETWRPTIVIENKFLRHLQKEYGHDYPAVTRYVINTHKYKRVATIAKDAVLRYDG